jgi:hypothetical protein
LLYQPVEKAPREGLLATVTSGFAQLALVGIGVFQQAVMHTMGHAAAPQWSGASSPAGVGWFIKLKFMPSM